MTFRDWLRKKSHTCGVQNIENLVDRILSDPDWPSDGSLSTYTDYLLEKGVTRDELNRFELVWMSWVCGVWD